MRKVVPFYWSKSISTHKRNLFSLRNFKLWKSSYSRKAQKRGPCLSYQYVRSPSFGLILPAHLWEDGGNNQSSCTWKTSIKRMIKALKMHLYCLVIFWKFGYRLKNLVFLNSFLSDLCFNQFFVYCFYIIKPIFSIIIF